GERAILLSRERDVIHVRAADGSSPQAVQLKLDTETGVTEAAGVITRLHPERVEVFEPSPLPRLIDLIRQLGLPVHPWLTTGTLSEAITSLPGEAPLFAPGRIAQAFAKVRWPGRKIILQNWPIRPPTLKPVHGARRS